jgi:hypothetical protein
MRLPICGDFLLFGGDAQQIQPTMRQQDSEDTTIYAAPDFAPPSTIQPSAS